ncbi:MAG: Wzz/FepE/Etk N-terminal domain-containing protein [Sphingobacteriia bacterium]|jgi:uncharacterized protein involved in exopolysaccharide biosynthesis
MQQNNVPILKMNDVFEEIQAFFSYLLSKAKLFLVMMAIGLVVAFIYSLIQKPKFQAKATFILEEKSSGMGGGISGLASQFGVDVGSLTGSAGLFAGDNILDIIKSRTIIEKVLLTKVDSSKSLNSETLADLFLQMSKLKEKWSNKPGLNKVSFASILNRKDNTRLQDSVLMVIYEKIIKKNISVERLNKKGSIIEITTTTPNEVFSKLFTERLVLETIKMYVDIKTSVAVRNIYRLEKRSDSLMDLLNSKSFKSASLQVLDANSAYKTTAVPIEVSQRDKSVTYALYSEVMKNLEASRMSLAGQTPVINMLDQARYPLEDQRLEYWLLLLIGAGAGFLIAFLIAFYTYR